VGFGTLQAPEVQGSVKEVHDPDGNVINGEPDYRSDSKAFVAGPGDTKATLYGEIGYNFLQRAELGWNSARGAYAFVNALDLPNFTLSLSPAYNKVIAQSRDRDNSMQDGEKKFRTSVENASLHTIASVFLGDRSSLGVAIYGGHALHKYTVTIKDHRSNESAHATEIANGFIAGFGIENNMGTAFMETSLLAIPQRSGKKPLARTFAFGASVLMGNDK
jgi:hypothetical protein